MNHISNSVTRLTFTWSVYWYSKNEYQKTEKDFNLKKKKSRTTVKYSNGFIKHTTEKRRKNFYQPASRHTLQLNKTGSNIFTSLRVEFVNNAYGYYAYTACKFCFSTPTSLVCQLGHHFDMMITLSSSPVKWQWHYKDGRVLHHRTISVASGPAGKPRNISDPDPQFDPVNTSYIDGINLSIFLATDYSCLALLPL